MTARATAAAAVLVCIAGAAAAPHISADVTPELETAMRQAAPTERIPVVATLARQAEPAPGQSPIDILRALRRAALRTQPGLLARLGLTDARTFFLVNVIAVRSDSPDIRLIAADPAVGSVNLDPTVVFHAVPASTRRLFQAGTANKGLDAIGASRAWREVGVTGTSVTIGTIDTGVDARHPALAGKVVGWRDIVGGRPAPYDDHGHGTHTAGTLVGGDARSAPLGVAPGAKLLVAKGIPASGLGAGSDILAAAEWLADPDGNPATADFPQVISNSWGEVTDPNDSWFRPMLRRWRALGIVPVFAAGNAGPGSGSVGSPSGYPEALAVGAVDGDRGVADFSSRGPVAWQNRDGLGPAAGPVPKPDLAGPGVGIVSSVPGGGYLSYSGTSVAAPHVAGVAALMRSANPSLTAAAVERILRSTAKDVGPPGRDSETGEGVVDALAATLRAARLPGASPRVEPDLGAVRERRRGRIRVEVTVVQLRINRSIALTALARVGRLESRLGVHAVAEEAPPRVLRVSANEMRFTQRIGQAALRRTAAVERIIASAPVGPVLATVGRTGRVRPTVRQLLINQRIAQAAMWRITRAEARAEASGVLPPD